jgi:hypothetical protein
MFGSTWLDNQLSLLQLAICGLLHVHPGHPGDSSHKQREAAKENSFYLRTLNIY